MIESLVNFLQVYVLPLGTAGVFLASVIEEVIAPIPSALVMTMSGFIFVSGGFDLQSLAKLIFLVAAPAALGVTLGSLAVFYAAWWGGKPLIDRFGKWLGLSWQDVEKLNSKFVGTHKDELIIVGVRILPVVPSVAISALCGMVRMSLWKYLPLTLLGTFIRAIILGALGWQTGNLYVKYAGLVDRWEGRVTWGVIAIAVLAILYVTVRRFLIYSKN